MSFEVVVEATEARDEDVLSSEAVSFCDCDVLIVDSVECELLNTIIDISHRQNDVIIFQNDVIFKNDDVIMTSLTTYFPKIYLV